MVQNIVEVTDSDGNTTEVEGVFEIDYQSGNVGRMRDNPSLGEATIVCANSDENRSISSGDEIVVKSNGEVDFSGYVTNQPGKSQLQSAELEIGALDKRSQLKYQKVNRVFYQMDTTEIVREAVQHRSEPLSETLMFDGTSLGDWQSDTNYLSNGQVGDQSLVERGGDFVFLGWQKEEGGIYHATRTGIPQSAVDDGNIERLTTRVLVNNKGEHFTVAVELRDYGGNNYNWTIIDGGGSGGESSFGGANGKFEVHELKAENATPEPAFGDPLTTDGAIRYKFKIGGGLPEPRAAAIDYATTIPFRLKDRESDIDLSGVEDRGDGEERVITRRFDSSVRDLLQTLSTEEGYVSRIDVEDVLHFVPVGDRRADLSIDYAETNIVDAQYDRDYKRIKNKVQVQGDGNVRITVEDNASIRFYGISAREEAIVDKSIQTEDEAVSRARGYLEKHAWHEGAITFEIADSDYQQLRTGQSIEVMWPPENTQGTFIVNNVSTDDDGIVTVELTQ